MTSMWGRRQVLWALVGLMIAAAVVAFGTAALVSALNSGAIRGTQQANTETLDNSAETLKRVRECTTPGLPCYDDGQKRTAELVARLTNNLTRVSAYAAACADKPGVQGKDEIFACVVAELAAEPDQP